MSISPPRVLEGRALGGRYQVVRPIGDPAEGLFAVRDPKGALLTLKLFESREPPSAFADRLRADSAVSARPEHPNLLPVLDIGVAPELERAYVALPALVGSDVRRLVTERGPLEPAVAVRIVLAACSAVAALHSCGIVPRSIRPADLRLEPGAGDELTVRMLLLEPLRDGPDDALSGSEIVPNRAYLSPEQLERLNGADARSNVWGLGACLYFMLSGRSPSPEATGGQVTNVQDLAAWIEPGLAVALHLALLADPEKRWPSADAFEKALTPFAYDVDRVTGASLVAASAETRAKRADPADLRHLSAPKKDPATSVTATSNSSTGLFKKLEHEPGGLSALVGHKLAGRYEVIRPIGKGGMGAVFEVKGPDGRLAAAKLIDRRQVGVGEETYRRFVREAKAASLLASDHVVRTIEAGIDQELKAPFILMELLNGVDLKTLLKEKGPLKPDAVVRLFVQAAKGIVAAHQQRIVHRDIKPANLFLDEQSDGRVVVKVCDFGIAKRTLEADEEATATGDLTRTGGMLGSPLYMSPEQATNARNVDHRTDIWSLCISMYETLSGKKPFGGRSALGEIIVAICTQPVPPLRRIAPWIDRDLAEVIHRGLKAELGERWATMQELVDALEPFTGGTDEFRFAELEPVSAEDKSKKPSSLPPPGPDHEAATIIGGVVGKPGVKQAAPATPASRGKVRGLVVMGGIAAVTAAVIIAVRRERPHPVAEPAVAPSVTETVPSATPVATSEAHVQIVPPEAEVTIDGKPAKVSDGKVTLNGVPGTAFELVLTLPSGAKKSAQVVLTREGGASPDSLEVRDEPADKIAKPLGNRRPAGARPSGSAPAADTTKPAGEPTSKPATDPTQKPDFKTEW